MKTRRPDRLASAYLIVAIVCLLLAALDAWVFPKWYPPVRMTPQILAHGLLEGEKARHRLMWKPDRAQWFVIFAMWALTAVWWTLDPLLFDAGDGIMALFGSPNRFYRDQVRNVIDAAVVPAIIFGLLALWWLQARRRS